MSNDKNKPQDAKSPAAKTPSAKPAPIKVPPLFRRIDWFVLAFTFGVVWIAYLFTLAPEQTLEDSGELCTASYYAGIPHPPGYPFWAIYSWLWTVIVPFGNVAWRVEVGESCALAMGCGLVGFMVSRGSSMLIEGIEELKTMNRQWENAICVVTGIVAGLLLGFDGFVWKEAVVINRISIFDVPWIMVVALCLMRWIYAPHQRRYLYIAMFFFGVCATIHQTMLVAAMGIEVCIAVGLPRLGRDLFLGNSIVYGLGLIGMGTGKVPALNDLSPMFQGIFHAVGIGSVAACIWLGIKTKKMGTEWKAVLFMGLLWMAGASFYFYEPLSGMTDPPMQWGYPRTVEGFFHALSRGQYEKANPTDIVHDPGRFVMQLGMMVSGLASSFSWVYIFISLLPFIFLFKMKNRERAWIIGLAAIYLCIGVLLTIIMNPTPDRQTADEDKVFFAASHAVVAIMIGYGLALMTAYMATHYEKFRRWGLLGGGIAVALALYCLVDAMGKNYFGPAGRIDGVSGFFQGINQAFAKDQYASPVYANMILLASPLIFIAGLLFYRNRAPVLIALCIFAAAPVYSGLSHWYKSEQHNHWFGYWFGHDMFTPPFTDQKTGQLSYDNTLRAELLKNPENAKIIYPEMARNTILFGGTDPGRFCPTYAIFCDSFIPHNCQPLQDQKFDRRDVYLITQNALADGTYLDYLRAQYFRSQQQDPPFFREFLKYILGIPFGPDSSFVRAISDASYHLLDVPFTKLGAKVEARRRAEGVYPPNEIYIPSPQDSQDCFQQYTEDVGRRQQLGQLRPGEDVHVDEAGRVQVSGQVAVMEINGLLCKVIFDHNPTNEFYVEESFPLDWMYPYETPFGIIMHINRNPQPELSDDVFKNDHTFWTKYSDRLIGNWITYDTSVKQIADFAEKIYIGNNYAGYTGDRKFIRDDDAQKAFSKLRSSQAGMYAWRLSQQCPPEYRQKTEAATQALIRETDFAFKQSFAFCPYSPEAVFRYVNFLLQYNRIGDALIVAQTCQKLDPYNDQIIGLVKQLGDFQKQFTERSQEMGHLQQMETEANQNPGDVQNLMQLAGAYMQMQQTNRAIGLFDLALTNKTIPYGDVAAIAQFYSQIGDLVKLETTLEKLVSIVPDQPESRYDLAALQAVLGRNSDSLANLKIALDMSNKRLATNPAALDLLAKARKDPHLDVLRAMPEFQKIVPPN